MCVPRTATGRSGEPSAGAGVGLLAAPSGRAPGSSGDAQAGTSTSSRAATTTSVNKGLASSRRSRGNNVAARCAGARCGMISAQQSAQRLCGGGGAGGRPQQGQGGCQAGDGCRRRREGFWGGFLAAIANDRSAVCGRAAAGLWFTSSASALRLGSGFRGSPAACRHRAKAALNTMKARARRATVVWSVRTQLPTAQLRHTTLSSLATVAAPAAPRHGWA